MSSEGKPTCEDSVKIFIKDIHRLEQEDTNSNYYHFCGKLIRKVDIMGVITEVRRLHDCHLYRVDDCTGEILCRYNHHNEKNLNETREIEQLQDLVAERNFRHPSEIGVAMEHILEGSFKLNRKKMSPLEQGDCVHVQGFVSNFFDAREVNAFILYKVSSVADEIDRVFELSTLYSQVYSNLQD